MIEASMESQLVSSGTLAASITRTASTHTYDTIRWLVDPGLVDDAYRAYAYFRWVDDWLDQQPRPRAERLAFVQRQQALIDLCADNDPPSDLSPEERLLADLIRRDTEINSGLHAYIRNMMAVMAFDADRRWRLISQRELNEYTYWLAVAVTEAMHYFIGHDCTAPHGEVRYMAVTAAHMTHMLRDALEDVKMGYYNIPSEVLAASDIEPWDVQSDAYRDWVKARVRKARACFRLGKAYLAQVESLRCRVAGYAYTHRFEAVLDQIERADGVLQATYPEPKGSRPRVEMIGWALWMALSHRRHTHATPTRNSGVHI